MRKKIFISLAVVAIAIFFYNISFFMSRIVSINIEVNISPEIASKYFSQNNMLFIMIKNSKGAPLGLKKIIDPIYPVKTRITSEDILLKDLITPKLILSAEMNSHGLAGEIKKGDFFSSKNEKTFIISTRKTIQLDSVK